MYKASCFCIEQLAKDLLNPSPEEEKRKHKLKRLVQSPNSFFMDVKCPGEEYLYFYQPKIEWVPAYEDLLKYLEDEL